MSTTTTIAFKDLPKVGEALSGGTFAGILTQADSSHVAVVHLNAWGENLTWKKAIAWAKKQGGVLPTRPVAALLYANLKAKLQQRWHWTSEEDDASYAWLCGFDFGGQGSTRKSYDGCAVAVRLIHITA
jgi:hypothetical protein